MDYSFSCALLFLVPPLNSVWHPRSTGCSFSHGWSVQERLRMDSATTCAHCFSLILTVSGGSSGESIERGLPMGDGSEASEEAPQEHWLAAQPALALALALALTA